MGKGAIECYRGSMRVHGEEVPTGEDILECTVMVEAHA